MMMALLLAVGAFLVYLPALSCDFISTWDDRVYVLNNLTIRSFSWKNFVEIFSTPLIGGYFPLSTFSYTFDYALWGAEAWGYHLVNNILHAVNVGLLFLVLLRLGCSSLISFVVATVFAVHPVNVEAVTWVAQRKNVLASMFFFLSLLTFLKHARTGLWRPYSVALALFVLAILSKTTTIALSVIVLAWLYREQRLREWYKALPFVLLAALGAAVNVWVSVAAAATISTTLSSEVLLGEIYPTMLALYPHYLRLLFWPTELSGFYDAVRHYSFIDAQVLMGLVVAVVIPLLMFVVGNREIRFWLIWAVACFLPMANIIPIQVYYADRFLYLAQIGLLVLLLTAVAQTAERYGVQLKKGLSPLLSVGLVTLVVVLVHLTHQRIAVWKSDVPFWEDVVARYPRVYNPRMNLALSYERAGRYAQAADHYLASYNLIQERSALWGYQRTVKLSGTSGKSGSSGGQHLQKPQ